ncbi:MAG: HDOD domain-containing protein [Desulfobacterales bacterium]|nr:HDOD domain-containing protein [Desulfobacterales bacterium]
MLNKEKKKKLAGLVDQVNQSEFSSIRKVVGGIIRIIESPESTANDLKRIIQIDPPLTAKILRIANSAYYAPAKPINDIVQAIIYIGFNTIKELALSQKVCEIFRNEETFEGYSRIALWKQSIAVALMGKLIYRREFGMAGDNVYIAGLLHNLGIIAEDQFLHDDFRKILNRSRTEGKNLEIVELDVLGSDHAEVGRMIAEDWNFPKELTISIGCHHHPARVAQEFSRVATVLYIADYCCQQNGIGYSDAPVPDREMFNECLDKLYIKVQALDLIISDVEQELQKMQDQGLL